MPILPREIAEYIGPLNALEYPPQGTAFQVSILTSARGRFVLKVADTSARSEALMREAHILTVLKEHVPFIAQPLVDAAVDDGHAFLFSYLEGEPHFSASLWLFRAARYVVLF